MLIGGSSHHDRLPTHPSRSATAGRGFASRHPQAARGLLLVASVLCAALVCSVSVATSSVAGEPQAAQQPAAVTPPPAGGSHESGGHGLPESAVEIGRPFGFPVTNSMVVTWIAALALIVFARAATRKMTEVPGPAQNLMEWLIESLYGFLESIIGPHLVKRTFWFFATVFIFILAANWISLFPGVGTIGWGQRTDHGFSIEQPLFRGANADLNLTLAMSLVFFALWIVWAVKEVGVKGIAHELFAPKGDTTGALRVIMVVVFFAAGLSGNRLDPVPAGVPQFPALRQHLRRREHARGDVDDGAWPGMACCCRSPSTSWSSWSAWYRRWCSCC